MDGAKRILIADDAESSRDLLQLILQPLGYEIDVACDGEEALRLAFLRTPDLALIDLNMPRVDGYAVAREMRKSSPLAGVPIVAISAGLSGQGSAAVLAAGFSTFLAKPITPSRLRDTVNRILYLKH